MKSFDYVITDEVGIHARPAGNLAKLCKDFSSTVMLCANGKKVAASKLMAVMQLGVKKGNSVTIEVEGDDEDAAAAALETFFKENL